MGDGTLVPTGGTPGVKRLFSFEEDE